MRTVRPLLHGEFDDNACAALCGRPRARPALLCAKCLADYSEKAAAGKKARIEAQLSTLFDEAGDSGVPIERLQLHHLTEHLDPDMYWRDDFTNIVYRNRQAKP
jgi:hypothetical protein